MHANSLLPVFNVLADFFAGNIYYKLALLRVSLEILTEWTLHNVRRENNRLVSPEKHPIRLSGIGNREIGLVAL
jgi:hypothetical protein